MRMNQGPQNGSKAMSHMDMLSYTRAVHPELFCTIMFWSFGRLSWMIVDLTFSRWGEYPFSLCLCVSWNSRT